MKNSRKSSKTICTIFASSKKLSFFESLSNEILACSNRFDIMVFGPGAFMAAISLSPGELATSRSDLVILDTEYESTSSVLSWLRPTCPLVIITNNFGKFKDKYHDCYPMHKWAMQDYNNISIISLSDLSDLTPEIMSERMIAALKRRVFICHASEDRKFVDTLVRRLDAVGIKNWYSNREIKVGDSIVDSINDGIRNSLYMLIILSPSSSEKYWCRREVAAAISLQQDRGIKILPVLYTNCDIPPLLRELKFADFRSSFGAGLADLCKTILSKV